MLQSTVFSDFVEYSLFFNIVSIISFDKIIDILWIRLFIIIYLIFQQNSLIQVLLYQFKKGFP